MGVEEGDVVQSARGFSLQDLLGSVGRKRPASDPPTPSPPVANDAELGSESEKAFLEMLDASITPAKVKEPETEPLEDTAAWEMLSPLPRPGDPYVAFSRISSRPVPTIFFLGGNMLPNGYANSGFERVYFEEGSSSGDGPVLVVRFHGSVVTEVRIEGRNLIPLATHIGRQLVQWVRERPPGIAEEPEARTVVTRMTTGNVNPFEEG